MLVEYAGDSATLVIDENGQAHCHHLGSAAPPSVPLSLPLEGIPHPTDPSCGVFRQRASAHGIPICAFDCVSDDAVDHAQITLTKMLADVDYTIIHRLITFGASIGIIGRYQNTTDIPAHNHLKGQRSGDGRDFDTGTRGLGGNLGCPMTSVGEENVAMIGDSRYARESILVHEFAHCIMNVGLAGLPQLQAIKAAYESAMREGLHDRKSYMASNADEYWAEATQAWFEATVRLDATAGLITRDAVKARDPRLAAILTEVWGDGTWRYLDTAPGKFYQEKIAVVRETVKNGDGRGRVRGWWLRMGGCFGRRGADSRTL